MLEGSWVRLLLSCPCFLFKLVNLDLQQSNRTLPDPIKYINQPNSELDRFPTHQNGWTQLLNKIVPTEPSQIVLGSSHHDPAHDTFMRREDHYLPHLASWLNVIRHPYGVESANSAW
ncbi:hypothetical protein MLD38_014627 [Melastoma candidum]|uniref:Uncharacterized protein n=1 Tax=Melastoma candidum TaxID=119954 RepID=A0ACB9RHK9_9MYRT|nr:hypothetical protein MLD38_014627 [Melastoma candidum]